MARLFRKVKSGFSRLFSSRQHHGRYGSFPASERDALLKTKREQLRRTAGEERLLVQASIFELEGRTEKAMESLREATSAANPEIRASAHFNRAIILRSLGRYDTSVTEYEAAISCATGISIYAMLGEISSLASLQRFDDALALERKVLQWAAGSQDENLAVMLEKSVDELVACLRSAGKSREAEDLRAIAIKMVRRLDLRAK